MAAWLATVLALGAGVVALAALRARSLFVLAACVAGASSLAAGALVLLGAGDGAVALAAFGVGVAPVVLMGGVLLSARTAKTTRSAPWIGMIAVAAGIGAAALLAPELGRASAGPVQIGPVGLWIGMLVFVAAAAVVGLLGYGERGALGRLDNGRDG